MRDLDETDLEILAHFQQDARRSFKDLGDEVGLSGPAVSDRVQHLEEAGIINRFTIDVDRSQLRAGTEVFVRVSVPPGEVDDLKEHVAAIEVVEHVFVTADGDLMFSVRVPERSVHGWLDGILADAEIEGYTVTLLDGTEWQPSLEGVTVALTCAECSNTVDTEGESVRIDEQVYHFCCGSCKSRFQERYEHFETEA
jgi:DNA-binding Lrp family transcriptional regulator